MQRTIERFVRDKEGRLILTVSIDPGYPEWLTLDADRDDALSIPKASLDGLISVLLEVRQALKECVDA